MYAVLNALVTVGVFEGLIAILNLNQPEIFAQTAFFVGLFFVFQIILLYDLHFKESGSLSRARRLHESVPHRMQRSWKIFSSAFQDRLQHLLNWRYLKRWLSYLILPGIIYWSSMGIFYLNFGFPKIQQIFALLSSMAIFVALFYIKEIFSRGKLVVDKDIFVVLSVVKIYASAIAFGASLELVRSNCLNQWYLILAVFCFTFLLIFQALFQYGLIQAKNLAITLFIATIMAFISYLVLVFWGYNYFTAAVFLTACYNSMWGIFHHQLDKTLTFQAALEILVISLIIAGMLFGVTNFKAKILGGCEYRLAFK